MSKFLMMTIILPMILVACSNDDQISVEEPEPEILFLEGEYIQLDSTGSICDWFFQSGTSTYHLGNSYDEYFQVKSILTDTQ